MRISADMVARAPQFTNTLKDREIDLRGRRIPAIENLGTTLDQFDTYDFTNNDIRRLGGFPRLTRLQTLLLINNRITRIAPDLGGSVPNLSDLNLKGNNIAQLGALQPLASCAKLGRLCLIGNPVYALEHYRSYVIYLVPQIKLLDFQRVKDDERRQSKELFEGQAGAALLEEIAGTAQAAAAGKGDDADGATVANGDGGAAAGSKAARTSAEVAKIKEAIANASSLEEVNALQQKLKDGSWGAMQVEQ
mmetsp:Transcript_4987/g.12918  ORF Transcript_4987/g.12918 Transcript_4987/m.12918 type:complete len:249 (-) Transcript_4987:211-957(-)